MQRHQHRITETAEKVFDHFQIQFTHFTFAKRSIKFQQRPAG